METDRFGRFTTYTNIAKVLGIGGTESCSAISDHRSSWQTASVRNSRCVITVETFSQHINRNHKKNCI